jgi:hypothetical protein
VGNKWNSGKVAMVCRRPKRSVSALLIWAHPIAVGIAITAVVVAVGPVMTGRRRTLRASIGAESNKKEPLALCAFGKCLGGAEVPATSAAIRAGRALCDTTV